VTAEADDPLVVDKRGAALAQELAGPPHGALTHSIQLRLGGKQNRRAYQRGKEREHVESGFWRCLARGALG
jgi:hypothetical protein